MRKGPEHLPNSILVLYFAFGLLVLALVGPELITGEADAGVIFNSFVNSFTGYALYYAVLLTTGFTHRAVPAIASVMACGSILTIAMIIVAIVLTQLLGTATGAILILFWSVPVKGHIIARAIERHWYVGIAIAMTIFVIQYVSYQALTAVPEV